MFDVTVGGLSFRKNKFLLSRLQGMDDKIALFDVGRLQSVRRKLNRPPLLIDQFFTSWSTLKITNEHTAAVFRKSDLTTVCRPARNATYTKIANFFRRHIDHKIMGGDIVFPGLPPVHGNPL